MIKPEPDDTGVQENTPDSSADNSDVTETKEDATMAGNERSSPSNAEIYNMLKEMNQEHSKQSKAIDSKLRNLSSDISFIKNELAKQAKNSHAEADSRLSNIILHELQTFCQLVVPAIEVGEEFLNDVEDPDDVHLNVYFHGDGDVLSTFYPVELSLDGKLFKSAEHLYQYKKAEALGQGQVGEEILKAQNGRSAKAIAKRNLHVTPDWDGLKEGVMEDVLQVKAMQCREFRERLLLTGNRRLIHDTPDPVWGWGRDGCGQNIMGRALERIRGDLEERSSSVFMDDDIAQIPSPEASSPTTGRRPDELRDVTPEDILALEENFGNSSRMSDDSQNASQGRKKYKKNRYDRNSQSSYTHGHGDADDGDSGYKDNTSEGASRNLPPSGKGKSKPERSVYAESSGPSLQVKVKSMEDESTSQDGQRESRRGRRYQKRGQNSRQSDYHEDDDSTHQDGQGEKNWNDHERQEYRNKGNSSQESGRYVRGRDDNSGYHHDGARYEKRQWSGQRHRGGQHDNRNSNSYYNSRRSRPNYRKYGRGRGQNYFNRDHNNRRNNSESDSHADQNFMYDGRMYADHTNGDGSERYHGGDGHRRGGGGFGMNHHHGFQHQHHHSPWHPPTMGRGIDSHKGHYGGGQGNRKGPGGGGGGGGGGQRYSGGPRQVDLGNEGDQFQVTVENSGGGGADTVTPDCSQPADESTSATINISRNNPQGHPEGSSQF